MTAPYVLIQTSPRLLRLFFSRNPEAMVVFRNVVHGEPLGSKVFFDGSKSSLPDNDPIIEFMVEKMIQFSLLTRVGNKIEANYSDIIIRSDSFTSFEVGGLVCEPHENHDGRGIFIPMPVSSIPDEDLR